VAVVVETQGLRKTYMLGRVPVQALRDIDLRVCAGDFLAVVGPSGSGKSTLLNLIGALDKPTNGRVLIDGVDVSALDENELAELRRRIGFVFQFFNLIPRLTALENVELPLTIAGVGRGERRRHAEELLRMVGLGDRADHKPAELSGGEQQRVAIARALANNPAIILADEPTGNLDQKTGLEIVRLLGKLSVDQGTTIVMVTHDSQMASQTQRMLFLSDGKLLAKEREGSLLREKVTKCPSCGRELPEEAEYCPRCGRKL